MMHADDDAFALVGMLHRRALCRLSRSAQCHVQGINQGISLHRGRLGTRLIKELRQLETAWGLLRHITAQSSSDLIQRLERQLSGEPEAPRPEPRQGPLAGHGQAQRKQGGRGNPELFDIFDCRREVASQTTHRLPATTDVMLIQLSGMIPFPADAKEKRKEKEEDKDDKDREDVMDGEDKKDAEDMTSLQVAPVPRVFPQERIDQQDAEQIDEVLGALVPEVIPQERLFQQDAEQIDEMPLRMCPRSPRRSASSRRTPSRSTRCPSRMCPRSPRRSASTSRTPGRSTRCQLRMCPRSPRRSASTSRTPSSSTRCPLLVAWGACPPFSSEAMQRLHRMTVFFTAWQLRLPLRRHGTSAKGTTEAGVFMFKAVESSFARLEARLAAALPPAIEASAQKAFSLL
uniref:Uncharacterized protein n=1 Tax=Alexandrium monilatum TaxID=311494 RepID=A0A7S4WKG4_9DINO